ncbi:MAG: hypothetical protein ABR915_05460 [Thermoguttaceae bacterium]|jgi:hypothetical protein
MDTFGKIGLGIAAVAVVAALVGFYVLSRKGPRGAVLAAAGVLYFLGLQIQPGTSRELYLAVGVLRMTGFIGGILGIIDLMRKRPANSQSETPVPVEIVEEPKDGTLSSATGETRQGH